MTNVTRTNRNGKRPKSNFYPTPPDCTRALIRTIWQAPGGARSYPPREIWECAAGDGAMGNVFIAENFDVVMTELRDGAGSSIGGSKIESGRDFFKEHRLLAPCIVTNPPYGRGILNRFIRHALSLRPQFAAFFLALDFLASDERSDLIEGRVSGLACTDLYVFRKRPTLGPKGLKLKNKGAINFGWFVWRRSAKALGGPKVWRIDMVPDLDIEGAPI